MKTDGQPPRGRKRNSGALRWIISVFFLTVVVSAAVSYVSSELLDGAQLAVAFIILLLIVAIGI